MAVACLRGKLINSVLQIVIKNTSHAFLLDMENVERIALLCEDNAAMFFNLDLDIRKNTFMEQISSNIFAM